MELTLCGGDNFNYKKSGSGKENNNGKLENMKLTEEIEKILNIPDPGRDAEELGLQLTNLFKDWALEMVGEEKELPNPYVNPQTGSKEDFEINGYNKAKREIKENILKT